MAEKLKRLTKEQLLTKPSRVLTETMEIKHPDFTGEVEYRGIRTTAELDHILNRTRYYTNQKTIVGHPTLEAFSESDIANGVYLSVCMTDPQLDELEAMELGQTIGPQATILTNRILELSGMTPKQMGEEGDKILEETPFQANGVASVSEIPEEASV